MNRNAATAWACSLVSARRREAMNEVDALVYLLAQLYHGVDPVSIDRMGPADLRIYLISLRERS